MDHKKSSSSSEKGNSQWGTIIVAVIGLLGTLATVYFGFLSNTRPLEIAIYTTQTAEANLRVSPSAVVHTPSVSLVTATPLQTVTMTTVPDSVISEYGFDNNCISINSWTPYKGEVYPIENGCWKLLDLGFYVQNSTLLIAVENNKSGFQHGIYTSIPLNARIDFKIQVEKVETLFDQPAKITFGVIQSDPLDLESGKYLTYQFNGISQPDFLSIKLGDSPDFGQFIADKLYIGGSQNRVSILLDGLNLQVFLDGNQIGDMLTIPFENRSFWIGFNIPMGSELFAKISEFAIQEK